MSSRADPEAHVRSDEQTPLLADQHPDTEHPETEPTPEKRPKSWYAWRIFWAVLAIVILAVFIKGWIDSDETEVYASNLGETITNARSSILRKL